jgi:hypothetical protein
MKLSSALHLLTYSKSGLLLVIRILSEKSKLRGRSEVFKLKWRYIVYERETWLFTLREELRLRVFENRVLRVLFGRGG